MKPLKEAHDKYVPGLHFLVKENGARVIIAGRPGSGKSVLAQNFFRPGGPLYQKFDNCYLIIPQNSFGSVDEHPFKGHDKVYHEITDLVTVMDELNRKKRMYLQYQEYLEKLKQWRNRQRNRKRKGEDTEQDDDSDPPPEKVEPAKLEYSVLLIDDFGPMLKEREIDLRLKDFFSRSRHLMCQIYVLCQDYLQLNKTCRKLLSHSILFAPSNMAWEIFTEEQLLESKKEAMLLRRRVFNEKYNTLAVDEEKCLYKNFAKISCVATETDPSYQEETAASSLPTTSDGPSHSSSSLPSAEK